MSGVEGPKPCPFCGGPARTFYFNGTAQATCAGDFTDCAGADSYSPVAMWNRRAPSVPTEQADGGVVGDYGPVLSLETRGPAEDARRRREAEEQYYGARRDFNWMRDDGSTPPATPIAGGFGSSPDGDTHRAADTAVVGGQIAWRVGTPPQDGSTFYGHWWSPCRWLAYKPNSEQARRGVKGRWQTMNEFGGWVNASAPNEWATEAQIRARQQAAPASDTTARYEVAASDEVNKNQPNREG